uniref:Uncharacterized protein n=1 Tax=Rhizophora mucronata TaxID=61149 RepID=A0A2P2KS92_RHIMU
MISCLSPNNNNNIGNRTGKLCLQKTWNYLEIRLEISEREDR